MGKTLKIYIFLLAVLLVAIVVIDINRPKPIDWTPTYSIKDKIPYGMYVFDNEIGSLLKNQSIEKFSNTPYEYFDSDPYLDTLISSNKKKGTFVSISKISNLDDQSINTICSFVRQGNSAFISSETIPNSLLDSLNLVMDSEYKYSDSIYNWVANKKLGTQKYKIIEGVNNNYFSKIDTLNTTVLGYQNGDSARVNFIKVKYKNGDFYLHTQPVAFTNFHLLKGNHHEYAEKVLSYIPKGNVFWSIKDQNGEVISNSPMRYILSQPALRWAWYIFLIGMLVFIFFNAKRKQRVVPIIKPLTNTTVDFTKTIGNLYYQEGDHNNIIDKKIIYFLEKIRNEYLIDTNKLDDDFIKKLHHKSGKDLASIQNAVYLINLYRKSNYLSVESDLIHINAAIEKILN
ncbi:DUF4350 domain-containing protein [Flavobacterium sp. HJJ]|uniref:DUF4350 domain-containing protein n=1 Tax=Flavobacterium sp. HJJ TaxID=2783792 RepID=UPI00188AA84B|nr:DUF4350 domain-containing protein [Flavobacterium sp. HJJ]MBF4471177.1 DUF4350 domain-containing protein [Flavobacterium sp. HJJ]